MLLVVMLLLLSTCGTPQEALLATRAARTVGVPTPGATLTPIIRDGAYAIHIARTVVSPYLATWQDVVAVQKAGVWRVIFREYYPPPENGAWSDDYYRVPLSVYIDAATRIVLRQEYRYGHSMRLLDSAMEATHIMSERTIRMVIAHSVMTWLTHACTHGGEPAIIHRWNSTFRYCVANTPGLIIAAASGRKSRCISSSPNTS